MQRDGQVHLDQYIIERRFEYLLLLFVIGFDCKTPTCEVVADSLTRKQLGTKVYLYHYLATFQFREDHVVEPALVGSASIYIYIQVFDESDIYVDFIQLLVL